jgi:hypothetical protein
VTRRVIDGVVWVAGDEHLADLTHRRPDVSFLADCPIDLQERLRDPQDGMGSREGGLAGLDVFGQEESVGPHVTLA